MITERLYYDSSELQFDAAVVDHDGDRCRVVLDRTAFYPTSGGQPHDTGLLGEVRVIDVIDDGERIVHVTDRPLESGLVLGQVDAERRADFTVQHTAQHLLSALGADRFGWPTASVHFGEERSLIEFETDAIDPGALVALEEAANAVVAEGRPVTVGYEDAAVARDLRTPPKREGLIRVVTIDGLDRSACGGTHVTTTAHLGSVMVRGVERMRGRIRVGFLAGPRAMGHSRRADAMLDLLAEGVDASVAALPEIVSKRMDQLRDAGKRIATLEREVAELRIRALVSEAPPGSGGVRWLELRAEDLPVSALRQMAEAATREVGVVFVGSAGAPPTVVLATHPETGIDAGSTLKSALAAVGGRGGGSPRQAQGVVPDAALLDRVVDLIRSAG